MQYFFVQLIGWAVTTQLISFSAGLLVTSRRQLSRVPCLKSHRTTAPGCRYVGRKCNLYKNKINDKLVQATQHRDGKTSPNLTASLDSKSELALWIVSHCQVPSLPQSFSFLPFLYFLQFWKYVPFRQTVDVRIMCGNCRWVLRCHDIAKNQNYLESPCNVMINWKENPDISLLVTRSTWKSLYWANVVLGKTSRRENGWISNGIQGVIFFSDFKTQAAVIFLPGAQGKILPGFWKLSVWWIHYGEGWIFIESSLGKEKN